MVVKVYGVAASTCTKRVLATLVEKNVPYELITLDFATAEHKGAEYLKKQPFGKIPALEDDGYIVYESRAISKYIAAKYAGQGTKLIPSVGDVKAYGLFEQACSIEQNYFNGPAEGIAVERVFKKFRGGESDETVVTKLAADLDNVLAVYDGILSKQKYLGGDEFSLADLFHLPYGALAKNVGFASTFEKYPNVNKWFDSIAARESWVKVGNATL